MQFYNALTNTTPTNINLDPEVDNRVENESLNNNANNYIHLLNVNDIELDEKVNQTDDYVETLNLNQSVISENANLSKIFWNLTKLDELTSKFDTKVCLKFIYIHIN